MCVCVCRWVCSGVCVCVPPLTPPLPPPILWAEQQNPPSHPHSPPIPPPYPRAIARPTPGKNYPCDSVGLVQGTKPPQGRKYEKITKKKIQNPPPRVWPRKYEKITEKLQKWSFPVHFCIFSVIFSYFRGPTRGEGVLAEKGARFRGKWGLGAPFPPPPK